jgi:hypothetical protein
MDDHREGRQAARTHDRSLLLLGAKRNVVLGLDEVERYGVDSFGDEDYVCLYGMRPADWYEKGIRVLGRTAVECTRDVLAEAIAADIAAIAHAAPRDPVQTLILDPFAGSANTLFWILWHLPTAHALGFEADPVVFAQTQRNLALLHSSVELRHVEYPSGLTDVSLAPGQLLVSFLAPPWGEALSSASGLDLRRTGPPVAQIVDTLVGRFEHAQMLCAIQIHETVDMQSLDEVSTQFDWSRVQMYDGGRPGNNHGVLIGTRGWVPQQMRAQCSSPSFR